jgi:hypothetical protein
MDVALFVGQIKAQSQLPGTIVRAQFKYFKSRNKGSVGVSGKRIGVSAMGRIGVFRRARARARPSVRAFSRRGNVPAEGEAYWRVGVLQSCSWLVLVVFVLLVGKQFTTTCTTNAERKDEHEHDNEHEHDWRTPIRPIADTFLPPPTDNRQLTLATEITEP